MSAVSTLLGIVCIMAATLIAAIPDKDGPRWFKATMLGILGFTLIYIGISTYPRYM